MEFLLNNQHFSIQDYNAAINLKRSDNNLLLELHNIKDDFLVFTVTLPLFEEDNNGEERLRRCMLRAVSYCQDVGVQQIAVDLTYIKDDVFYVLNVMEEEFDNALNDNYSVNFYLPEYKIDTELFAKFKKEVVTQQEDQSFSAVDDLIGEFKRELKKPQIKFNEYLVTLIDDDKRRTLFKKDSEVYKAAQISKDAFNKIKNGGNIPTRETVAALALGLKLDFEETKEFYAVAGYSFGYCCLDSAVQFFIKYKIYDLDTVNIFLYESKMGILGYKPKGFER